MNDEIEKAEKTLKLMEQNAEKIKIEDQDGSYWRILKANETFGVVESIKAVSDLYSPINGKVIQTNGDLPNDPGKINLKPHEEWMLVLESPTAKADVTALMDSDAYSAYVKTL